MSTTNHLIELHGDVERVERFQSLQTGQYWRAQGRIAHEGIDEGEVLLIQSIRCVDDKPHTIILRPHPSKIGRSIDLDVPREDGSVRRNSFLYDEHRLLLSDFLSQFEFEPDHQRIRAGEVRALQGRITALQTELLETQTSPVLLANVVEAGLRERAGDAATAQANPKRDAPAAQGGEAEPALPVATTAPGSMVALATGTVANAIGSGITSEGVAALKAAACREHEVATIKAEWIQGKTTEIATTIKQMTPFYEEQAAAALAQTEDVRSYVAKLLKGIESLDLYIGKGVEVQAVREGRAASKDVPLTFVQRKLLMDEELAVWEDVDEQFDFEQEHLFFDALREHDGLVEQVFPTERCVLVMATTRRYIDYGNGYSNAARNDENRKVFLLVRNGMNIHRVFSPVESHLGSDRLFPTADDQERVFRGLDGSQVKFEDVAYTDRLEAHERFALHYKRFLLLACGLDHRLKLFGDFYEGPQSLNFVSMEFQERHCRFLHDDDGRLLPGIERPSFEDWLAEKNAYLRSGSRVLCNWGSLMNPDTAPGACKPDRSHRGFDRRYRPEQRVGLAVAFKDGDAICVEVEVTGRSYSSHAERKFNCKVMLTKFKNGAWDHVDQPFLCLDAVQPDDIHHYIHHRGSRRDHLSYIRFFKRALKHIEQERLEEKDARQELMRALAEGGIAGEAERPSIISQAVIAWRAANRGKPLPKFAGSAAGENAAAWKSLLDQMYMLAGEGERRVAEVQAFVQGLGLTPLRLVLSGGAKMVVYAAAGPEERDDRLEPHAWVHRITLERGKTKWLEKARRWASLPKQAASETTLHQWPQAAEWAGLTSAFNSYEHKATVMAEASRFMERLRPFGRQVGAEGAPMDAEEHQAFLARWKAARAQANSTSKYVVDPKMAFPFGLAYFPRRKRLRYLCVGADPQAVLAEMTGDEDVKKDIRATYIRPFRDKRHAAEKFDATLANGWASQWTLLGTAVDLATEAHAPFVSYYLGVEPEWIGGRKACSPLLADWFEGWQEGEKGHVQVWLANGAINSDGRLTMDELLGIGLPQDYEPLRVTTVEVDRRANLPEPKYPAWFDMADDERDHKADAGDISAVNPGHIGFRSHSTSHQTRKLAMDHIASEAGKMGKRVVLASALEGAPQPPEGIERWYVVDGTGDQE